MKSFKAFPVKADTGIAEALRLGTTKLGMLNAGRSNTRVSQKIIEVLLLNLLDFFTAGWNRTQLDDCVEIIATEYYWFSQAEFKIFTLRCKKGHYGPDYGKLSPQRLLIWLEEFSKECRYERAGIQLQSIVVPRQVPMADDERYFDGTKLLTEFRQQLVIQTRINASGEADRQDENIRRYQNQLRERWRGLEEQRVNNELKMDI